MKFTELPLEGAYLIEIKLLEDERGFFARNWCRDEFDERGLKTEIAQCSTSFNRKKGTLRGMHYQAQPHEETKIVRCTRGSVYDIIVDIRPFSPTYKKWLSFELTADNRKSLYIPAGFAHGFQTLEDETELFYQISEPYRAELARGIRWNDPAFDFRWPIESLIISERDRSFPDFSA